MLCLLVSFMVVLFDKMINILFLFVIVNNDIVEVVMNVKYCKILFMIYFFIWMYLE